VAAQARVEIALSARRLTFAYCSHTVVDAAELSVERGGTLAILGRSGCGKSTLLKCLALLETPQAGELTLSGQEYFRDGSIVYEPWEIRRQIVLVFQAFNLFPNLNAERNITLPLRTAKDMSKSAAREHAHDIAKAFGIEHLLNRYPSELSGGQAQRLALARAVALNPPVLLLDEITSALDPETIGSMASAVASIRAADADRNLTIVMVTHLVKFAVGFASEIAFMANGRLIEQHPAAEFISRASAPQTCEYLGSPFISR